MLNYVTGNLVTDDYSFIVHQVNCKGVMGAGLAKQIRAKYPFVYYDYKKALDYENATLGHIVVSHVSGVNGKMIISMFAQDGYGRDRKYTNYEAFKKCLDVLAKEANSYSTKTFSTIAFPYGIGCGLAGGSWSIIEKMIEEFSEKVKQKVFIVKFGG